MLIGSVDVADQSEYSLPVSGGCHAQPGEGFMVQVGEVPGLSQTRSMECVHVAFQVDGGQQSLNRRAAIQRCHDDHGHEVEVRQRAGQRPSHS